MTAREFKKCYHYRFNPAAIIIPCPCCSYCAWVVNVMVMGVNVLRCQANEGKRMSVISTHKCDLYIHKERDDGEEIP